MTKQTFAKGMEYLNAFYVNLKINLDNPLVVEVWYDVFKETKDEDFLKMIKSYCLENVFAPQSPTSILEFSKQKYLESQPQAELEFEKIIELNKRYSIRLNQETVFAKINNEITKTVLKAFLNDFITIGDETRERVKKTFVSQYNSLLKANGNALTHTLLGKTENKLLGE